MLAREVVLAELDDGVGLAPRARVGRPNGFIGPWRSVSRPALRHRLDGQAALEVDGLLEVVERHLLARESAATNASYSALERGTFR